MSRGIVISFYGCVLATQPNLPIGEIGVGAAQVRHDEGPDLLGGTVALRRSAVIMSSSWHLCEAKGLAPYCGDSRDESSSVATPASPSIAGSPVCLQRQSTDKRRLGYRHPVDWHRIVNTWRRSLPRIETRRPPCSARVG